MARTASIEALIRKARTDLVDLRSEYENSLHEKVVREDLKVTVKNIFENLRSCLDYIAHDIQGRFIPSAGGSGKLYFPVRQSNKEFLSAIAADFPNLQNISPQVFGILEAIQPYNDSWLGKFNKLNNRNKHQDLVEQTRTEKRKKVTVTNGASKVSWGEGVSFGDGVTVFDVPIDPVTELPNPDSSIEVEVEVWVDFHFKETGDSVESFIVDSIGKVESLCKAIAPFVERSGG